MAIRNLSLVLLVTLGLLTTASGFAQNQTLEAHPFVRDGYQARGPQSANPWLAWMPSDATIDWDYWKTAADYYAQQRAQEMNRQTGPLIFEIEAPGVSGFNDAPTIGEPIPQLGSRNGQQSAITVQGRIQNLPSPVSPFPEGDDALPLANPLPLSIDGTLSVEGAIGDGIFGSGGANPSGDFDYYSFEVALGDRIEVSVVTAEPLADLNPLVGLFDASGNLLAFNDDIPLSGFLTTTDSHLNYEVSTTQTLYLVIGGSFSDFEDPEGQLPGDPFDPSSGPGVSSEGDYSLILTRWVDLVPDIDFFQVHLEEGDILGASIKNSAFGLGLYDLDNQLFVQSIGTDLTAFYGAGSPLPGGGRAAIAYVIEETGTYAIGVRNPVVFPLESSGTYQLDLVVSRPPLDRRPELGHQILYVDFNGATIDGTIFGQTDSIQLSPLADFLPRWGLSPDDESTLIDRILASLTENLESDIRIQGANGDFLSTGLLGDFRIEILNSRDHGDPFGADDVSRIIVGGTIEELGIVTIGLAQSIDVGNFAEEETGVVLLDLLSEDSDNPNSLLSIPLAPSQSILSLVGHALGTIIAHEAGHLFANFHTERDQGFPNVMDRGGNLPWLVGVGEDEIYGTEDDFDVDFGVDHYEPREGFTGLEGTLDAISFDLPKAGPRPILRVTPSLGQFGNIGIGNSRTLPFLLSNEGESTLTVGSVELSPPSSPFDFASLPSLPLEIPPAGSALVEITFTPPMIGLFSANTSILSNDPNQPSHSLPLRGQGGLPHFSVTPLSLDFGTLIYGPLTVESSAILHVTNPGVGSLVLESTTLASGNPEAFEVDDSSWPLTINGGETAKISVRFAPSGLVGSLYSNLWIHHNDEPSPTLITLEGQAIGPDIRLGAGEFFHFGGQNVAGSRFHDFEITNIGSTNLHIEAYELKGENPELFAVVGETPLTLSPTESTTIRIIFDPVERGEFGARLLIHSDDPDEGELELVLLGNGVDGIIAAIPPYIHFPDTPIGETVSATILLVNVGDSHLVIDNASLGGPDRLAFRIESGHNGGTILPGASVPVNVTFTPYNLGPFEAHVIAESDDLENPTLWIPLDGAGEAEAGAVDVPGLDSGFTALLIAGLIFLSFYLLRGSSPKIRG